MLSHLLKKKKLEVGSYISPIIYCLFKLLAWGKVNLNSLKDFFPPRREKWQKRLTNYTRQEDFCKAKMWYNEMESK